MQCSGISARPGEIGKTFGSGWGGSEEKQMQLHLYGVAEPSFSHFDSLYCDGQGGTSIGIRLG